MQAVIMAGGFGSRLRPLTNDIPKPMVPIVNKPILEHIFALLKTHNITDYTIMLYYMPEKIRDVFGDGSEYGVKIRYVIPDQDYGTAGAVKLAEKHIDDKFVVISGDVLTDFDLSEIGKFHTEKDTIATMALYSSKNPLQFGIVLTGEDSRIVRFLEKPSSSEVFSDTINTGIYFFNKEIFQHIPEKENYDFSKDLFPKLLESGIPIYGCKTKGYWRDVGNLDEYISSNMDVLNNELNYINETDANGNCISKSAKVDPEAIIKHSIIGDNVEVGAGAEIQNSVIWDGVKIGNNSKLIYDVIGKNCLIGHDTRINDYVFVGDNCTIGNNVFISSSIKIWDKKVIDDGEKVGRSLIYDDKFFTELFTDSRITGLSNSQVNPEFASKLGTVYGAFLGEGKRVLIARDIDYVSNMIKRSVSSGIMSAGVNVIDTQVIPIPILRQILMNGEGDGGIFVRKSPFDKSSSDIIFFDSDGKDLSSNKTKAIERLFFSEEYRRADYYDVGSFKFQERANEKYQKHFLDMLDIEAIKKAKFKLVIDYSYGIASTIFPSILGEFDCEIVSLNAHLDRDKITRSVEEFKDSFTHFSFVVKSLGYDLGFTIDAGGEKIWLASSEGKILGGDRFLVLVLKMYLMVTPGVKKVAVPVQATREVDIIAKEYGVEVVRVKDTHYAMMMACDDPDVNFVGGTRGGFLFPEFLYATDGMFSVAKILELIARSETSIDELDRQITKLNLKKENLECPKEMKGMIMRQFMEDNVKYEQELIDGVKIFINDNDTVLFTPDKHRGLVHLNVETNSEGRTNELIEEYKTKILSYIENYYN
jgi:mannose-1-phosphate guanylyltransferase/phosphomannomutase